MPDTTTAPNIPVAPEIAAPAPAPALEPEYEIVPADDVLKYALARVRQDYDREVEALAQLAGKRDGRTAEDGWRFHVERLVWYREKPAPAPVSGSAAAA